MTPETLTTQRLNRTLLARQLLLERTSMPLEAAIERIGGLQTQYAPSGYVGLWTRLADFRREALTEALEARTVIQGTLLRTTIHMVSRREYWPYAMGVRESRRAWVMRIAGESGDRAVTEERAERLRTMLGGRSRTVKELGPDGSGFLGTLGAWIDLVRVPPSGTWDRRRADLLALAEDWVGPPDATADEGRMHLVRAYLRAFGPAPWKDIATWAGTSVGDVRRAGEGLTLIRYLDEAGRVLIDLPGEPLPDERIEAPVRLLAHWDPVLLVHARRTGVVPEAFRARIFTSRNPFSVGTVLVGGRVVGAWSQREGRVALEVYEPVSTRDQRSIDAERDALEVFHR